MSDTQPLNFDTDELKVSYGFGLQFGEQLQRNAFPGLDLTAVFAGMTDSFSGHSSQISDAQLNAAYEAMAAVREAEAKARQVEQAELASAFLAENAKREGVTTTASGLQYEVLASGEGSERPGKDSTVVTHYHGMLPDGTVFDSSVNRGEPATFGVTQVIAGWTEALQMMTPGDKWRVVCPPELAYGERGAGGAIPPNAALVFDIELLEIKG